MKTTNPMVDESLVVTDISAPEARKKLENGNLHIIDIRAKRDYRADQIEGSINIEMVDIMDNLVKIPTEKKVGIICYGGGASEYITKLLMSKGYSNISNIEGGINNWISTLDNALIQKKKKENG